MNELIDTEVYAAKVKDRDILRKSSSGGMFTVLSDWFLERGYAVCCCLYDYEGYSVKLQVIETAEERDEARGSKYIQAAPGDAYQQCCQYLERNPWKELLFVGTGCLAAGFQRYAEVKGIQDRVVIIDLICHGGVSPEIWKSYVQMEEHTYHGGMSHLRFKDKRNGWKRPTAVADIDGKEVSLDKYMKLFYSGCVLRPACHSCPYATVERTVDMTIGDFWHMEDTMPDFFDPMGVSLVIIHSAKGMTLFESIMDRVEYRKSCPENCLQPNLIEPTTVSPMRTKFWREYEQHGVRYVAEKYGVITFRKRVIRKLTSMVKRFRAKS